MYIALFGNNNYKVGTTAEYRKFSRILEQGAIASIFIAKTKNGKIARLIEHTISTYGFTLQVTANYKINNLIIDKTKEEILEAMIKKYNFIKENLPKLLSKYLIPYEFNYYEDINNKNKLLFLSQYQQISMFDDKTDNKYNITYKSNYNSICGTIVNVVGSIIVIRENNKNIAYDLKKIEGFVIELNQ